MQTHMWGYIDRYNICVHVCIYAHICRSIYVDISAFLRVFVCAVPACIRTCFHVVWHMCLCECTCICVHHVYGGPRLSSGDFLLCSSPSILRQWLSVEPGVCQVSYPVYPVCSEALPAMALIHWDCSQVTMPAWLFHEFWVWGLQSSYLCGKYCNHRTISPKWLFSLVSLEQLLGSKSIIVQYISSYIIYYYNIIYAMY